MNTDLRSRRFDRAAATYEREARVQRLMARRLIKLIGQDIAPSRILELGCGTGLLTRALAVKFAGARILATDLAPSMIDVCRRSLDLAAAEHVIVKPLDARDPEQAGPGWDLVASNALVQWIEDPDAHLQALARIVSHGGHAAIAAFCRSNFPELNSLLARPPFVFEKFPGHLLEDVCRSATAAGWEVLVARQESWTSGHPDAASVIRHLSLTGASRLAEPSRTRTRGDLQRLMRDYDRLYSLPGGGVAVTWRPWWLVLRRK